MRPTSQVFCPGVAPVKKLLDLRCGFEGAGASLLILKTLGRHRNRRCCHGAFLVDEAAADDSGGARKVLKVRPCCRTDR